jgi:hypothetical protein
MFTFPNDLSMIWYFYIQIYSSSKMFIRVKYLNLQSQQYYLLELWSA